MLKVIEVLAGVRQRLRGVRAKERCKPRYRQSGGAKCQVGLPRKGDECKFVRGTARSADYRVKRQDQAWAFWNNERRQKGGVTQPSLAKTPVTRPGPMPRRFPSVPPLPAGRHYERSGLSLPHRARVQNISRCSQTAMSHHVRFNARSEPPVVEWAALRQGAVAHPGVFLAALLRAVREIRPAGPAASPWVA